MSNFIIISMLCRSAKIKFLPVFFSFLEVMGFPILVRHTLLQVSSDYYCMIFQVLKWLRLSSISRFLSVTAILILAPSDHHQHHPTLQSLPQTFRLLSSPSLSLGKVYIHIHTKASPSPQCFTAVIPVFVRSQTWQELRGIQ